MKRSKVSSASATCPYYIFLKARSGGASISACRSPYRSVLLIISAYLLCFSVLFCSAVFIDIYTSSTDSEKRKLFNGASVFDLAFFCISSPLALLLTAGTCSLSHAWINVTSIPSFFTCLATSEQGNSVPIFSSDTLLSPIFLPTSSSVTSLYQNASQDSFILWQRGYCVFLFGFSKHWNTHWPFCFH